MANENITADFFIDPMKKRRMLYFKRPQGTAIPAGMPWRCICGASYILTSDPEAFCGKCGARLRHQENQKPEDKYYTCVVVHHFYYKK